MRTLNAVRIHEAVSSCRGPGCYDLGWRRFSIMTSHPTKPFDLPEISRSARLALLNLTDRDSDFARRLHTEVIRPNGRPIVERFYAALRGNPETAKWVADKQVAERLRALMTEYLLSLGLDFDTNRYAAGRVRMGVTYARIGLPLSALLCSYNTLQETLIDYFPTAYTTDLQFTRRMISFVLRITTYDATLATEAYHSARVGDLERAAGEVLDKSTDAEGHSLTDPLTGIANRRHVLDVLGSSLIAARTRQQRITVLMVDLDDFKRINETFGNSVGDRVLVDVAKRIHSAIRGFDIVGRYGGEEFLVVQSGTESTESRLIAERIRRKISDAPIAVDGNHVQVTISIGLCDLQPNDTVSSLVARAEGALHAAKAAGKNQTYSYGGAA